MFVFPPRSKKTGFPNFSGVLVIQFDAARLLFEAVKKVNYIRDGATPGSAEVHIRLAQDTPDYLTVNTQTVDGGFAEHQIPASQGVIAEVGICYLILASDLVDLATNVNPNYGLQIKQTDHGLEVITYTQCLAGKPEPLDTLLIAQYTGSESDFELVEERLDIPNDSVLEAEFQISLPIRPLATKLRILETYIKAPTNSPDGYVIFADENQIRLAARKTNDGNFYLLISQPAEINHRFEEGYLQSSVRHIKQLRGALVDAYEEDEITKANKLEHDLKQEYTDGLDLAAPEPKCHWKVYQEDPHVEDNLSVFETENTTIYFKLATAFSRNMVRFIDSLWHPEEVGQYCGKRSVSLSRLKEALLAQQPTRTEASMAQLDQLKLEAIGADLHVSKAASAKKRAYSVVSVTDPACLDTEFPVIEIRCGALVHALDTIKTIKTSEGLNEEDVILEIYEVEQAGGNSYLLYIYHPYIRSYKIAVICLKP